MTAKSLILTATLAVASMSVAAAKSYEIVLSAPAKAANIRLDAGQYRMKMEGVNAVFTNTETGKTFTAPAKVENAQKKFDYTAVETTKESDADHIKSIELGGTNTTVEFGE